MCNESLVGKDVHVGMFWCKAMIYEEHTESSVKNHLGDLRQQNLYSVLWRIISFDEGYMNAVAKRKANYRGRMWFANFMPIRTNVL